MRHEFVINHSLSADTNTGTVGPLQDKYEACLITWWTPDMIKLAIDHELNISPEQIYPEHI